MGSAVLGEAISAIRDWSANREKNMSGAERKGLVRQPGVRRCRAAEAPSEERLRGAAPHGQQGRAARSVHRRRRRRRAEGLGHRERRDPLHALVPAADRHHRREARLVSLAGYRRQGGLRVLGQGARQGRARCVELSVRRHALDVRSARLHGVGSDQPAVAAEERRRDDARHSDRVRQLDRRGARQEDAAAALDGSPLEAGRPRAEALRLEGRPRRHDLRSRAGIFPHRPELLSLAPRPHQRRAARCSARSRRRGRSSKISTSAPSPIARWRSCRTSKPSSTRLACR